MFKDLNAELSTKLYFSIKDAINVLSDKNALMKGDFVKSLLASYSRTLRKMDEGGFERAYGPVKSVDSVSLPNLDMLVRMNVLSFDYEVVDESSFDRIIGLQTFREVLDETMATIGDEIVNGAYYELLKLQYVNDAELGLAWGFYDDKKDKNWNYFKFWEIPGVNQPRMDNYDNYPYGHYSFIDNERFSLEKHGELTRFATENGFPKDLAINSIF